MTSAKAFAKFAGWGAILEDYRAPSPGPTVPHPIPEGVAGVRRMIAKARKPQQAALVALCGLCGCRISEALMIRPSNFDLADKVLKINGKGEKIRYVPVSPEAWGVLVGPVTSAYVDDDALVVGIEERVARANITAMAKAARLSRHVSSHDLRATFATEAYNKTGDIRLVQELLGHSSVETTQIYIGVKAEAMRNAVQF